MLAKSYRRFSGGVIGLTAWNQQDPQEKTKKYDEWDIHHGNLLVPRNSVKYNISIHSFYINIYIYVY